MVEPTNVRLGHGIGLRTTHYHDFLTRSVEVDWVEVITENFLGVGGRPAAVLRKVSGQMPVVLHGVSLSIGGLEPLDEDYLRAVAKLAEAHDSPWVSDHLCFSSVGGHHLHDLLPIPYTEEALVHLTPRIAQVAAALGRPFALENPSTYLAACQSTMTEAEFLAELHARTGVGLLLDVNNVYVSSRNHGFDPYDYLDTIPRPAVWQFHLAGHTDRGDVVIDTHDAAVRPEVWDLYRYALRRFGQVASLVEWDAAIPELEVVVAESRRARQIAEEVSTRVAS
ncbi:MAG: DUF692 domain-containing protein [Myxococcota bacterium]